MLYAVVWAYRLAVAQLGPFAPLGAIFVGALVIAIGGPWLLIRFRRPLRAIIVRLAAILWALLQATGLPRWFQTRYPRLSRFLGARLIPGTATGLGLSIGLAVAFALLVNFIELLAEVLFGTRVVAVDRRILNLVATIRTPGLDSAMYIASYLGNVQTVLLLLAAALIMTLFARRWLDALLLLLAPLAAELFMALLKALVHRPRPPLEDARIVDSGFSFPSGHATLAAVFYGTLAFLVIRQARSEWLKVLIGMSAALIVLAVGVSRIYLGVHYGTDVLAGWALGSFWLVVVVLIDHVAQTQSQNHNHNHNRAKRPPVQGPPVTPGAPVASAEASLPADRRRTGVQRAQRVLQRAQFVGASVLVVLAVSAATYTYRDIPPPPAPHATAPMLITVNQLPAVVQTRLPHATETLTGKPQEPISIVLLGDRKTIERAFASAGWTEAARFGIQSVAGGISAALTHHADPAGPVTPSFYAEEPNTLAFSLPVGATFAQRHHIRIWSTDFKTTDGRPIWVATASFDEGFELSRTTFLPTHRIAPDIDTERAFVVASLTRSGFVTRQVTVQLIPPEQGHNFSGDPFQTDGRTVILALASPA